MYTMLFMYVITLLISLKLLLQLNNCNNNFILGIDINIHYVPDLI